MNPLRIHRVALVIVVLLALCSVPIGVSAQEDPQKALEGLREALESTREMARQFDEMAAGSPRQGVQFWQQRLVTEMRLRMFQRRIDHGGQAPRRAPEEQTRYERDLVWELTEAWSREASEDPGPLLARETWLTPEELDPWAADLARRYPADERVLALRVRRLAQADRGREAVELLERFVVEHPQAANARALLHERVAKQGDAARAAEVLEAWRRDIPADPLPVELSIAPHSSPRPLPPSEALAAVEKIDPAWKRDGFGGRASNLCGTLEKTGQGRYLEAARLCYEKVLSVADPEQHTARSALEGLVRVGALTGDRNALDRTLQSLDPARRGRVLASLASTYASSDRCGEVLGLASRLLAGAPDHLGTLARALIRCHSYPGAVKSLTETVAALPADDLPRLASDLSDIQLARTLVPVLARRHETAPSEETWRAMDVVLERFGDPMERLAHLEAWYAARPEDRAVVKELGSLLAGVGQVDRALAVYEASQGPEGVAFGRERMDLWLASGRFGPARSYAEKQLARDPDGPALLWLGRVAWAAGDTAEAARHYGGYLDAARSWAGDAVGEIASFRAATGDEFGLLELLEAFWRENYRHGDKSLSLYLAEELRKLGRIDLAEAYAREAEAGGAVGAALDEQIARARADGDPAALEALYRELMGRPEASVRHWGAYAHVLVEWERPEEALRVLDEAERRGEAVVGHDRLRLEALLDAGKPREAVTAARAVIESGQGDGFVYQLLRRGYRDLYRQR